MIARTSPLEPLWRERATGLRAQFGMPVPARCGDGERDRLDRVGIADVSGWPRATVKGPSCAEAVARGGFPVPDAWFVPAFEAGAATQPVAPWRFAARTGKSEYFVEGWSAGSAVPGTHVYVRQDASLLVFGGRVSDVLAEVLTLPIDLGEPRLHMLQMAGVSVVLTPRGGCASRPGVQIWVDPTYAIHLAGALLALAEELGGGLVGTTICEGEGVLPAET